jgi:hypothetical protein
MTNRGVINYGQPTNKAGKAALLELTTPEEEKRGMSSNLLRLAKGNVSALSLVERVM